MKASLSTEMSAIEKIVAITEKEGFDLDVDGTYSDRYDGFIIETTEQKIYIGVSDEQYCCESWGYVCSEDDPAEFLGADVLSVDVVDEALNKKTAVDIYEGKIMFVNIETSKGTLQFAVYNEHNGYYGHIGVVVSKQCYETECL